MDVDYRTVFNLAPVGLCVSRNRAIVDCNQQLCEMFGSARELLIGQSFLVLYPSVDEYERLGARMGPILNARGHYADDRIMKRANGEVFWCHVTGHALNREAPHEAGIWAFEDLSESRPVNGFRSNIAFDPEPPRLNADVTFRIPYDPALVSTPSASVSAPGCPPGR